MANKKDTFQVESYTPHQPIFIQDETSDPAIEPSIQVGLYSNGEELSRTDLAKYKKQNEAKTSHIYVALDSDVFRSLAWAESILINRGDLNDDRARSDPFIARNADSIVKLLYLAQIGKVRFYITRTVYHENKHLLKNKNNPIFNFAKNMCYFPDVTSKEYITCIGRSRVLAQTYCEPSSSRPAPMKSTYSEYCSSYIPENDAYIMAQVTVAGCYCLLTNNARDYLFNEKIDDETKKSRKSAIIDINHELGYGTYSLDGKVFLTTKPTTITSLIKTLEKYSDLDAYLAANDTLFKRANEIDLGKI